MTEFYSLLISLLNPFKELDIGGELKDLVKNPKIKDSVYKDLIACAKLGKLGKAETPSNIYLETEPWTPETGLVTDALKLKRKVRITRVLLGGSGL